MCSVGLGACRRLVIGGIREQTKAWGGGPWFRAPRGEPADRWGTGGKGGLPPARRRREALREEQEGASVP